MIGKIPLFFFFFCVYFEGFFMFTCLVFLSFLKKNLGRPLLHWWCVWHNFHAEKLSCC